MTKSGYKPLVERLVQNLPFFVWAKFRLLLGDKCKYVNPTRLGTAWRKYNDLNIKASILSGQLPRHATIVLPHPGTAHVSNHTGLSYTKYHLTYLLPIPHPRDLRLPHLLLKLQNSIHKRFTCRRASRNINVHRNNSITTSHNTVRVVVVSTPVCT